MKRSAQVALLLMGVGGVGAGAYALTPPRNNCIPQTGASPSAVAPNPVGAPGLEPCPPRRQGGGTGGGRSYYSSWWSGSSSTGSRSSSTWWGPIFGSGGNTTSTALAAGRSSTAGGSGFSSSGIAHGGFGSTGHGMSASS